MKFLNQLVLCFILLGLVFNPISNFVNANEKTDEGVRKQLNILNAKKIEINRLMVGIEIAKKSSDETVINLIIPSMLGIAGVGMFFYSRAHALFFYPFNKDKVKIKDKFTGVVSGVLMVFGITMSVLVLIEYNELKKIILKNEEQIIKLENELNVVSYKIDEQIEELENLL